MPSSRFPATSRRLEPCWPRTWRPRSTRYGTALRRPGKRSTSSGQGWWARWSAYLCRHLPGAEVTLADIAPERADAGGGARRRLRLARGPLRGRRSRVPCQRQPRGPADRPACGRLRRPDRRAQLVWLGYRHAALGREFPQPPPDPAGLAGGVRGARHAARAGRTRAGWQRRWSCCAILHSTC